MPYQFCINKNGVLSTRGLVMNGPAGVMGQPMFGRNAWPQYQMLFLQLAAGSLCRIDATTGGNFNFSVFYGAGTNGYVSMHARWFALDEGGAANTGAQGPRSDLRANPAR